MLRVLGAYGALVSSYCNDIAAPLLLHYISSINEARKGVDNRCADGQSSWFCEGISGSDVSNNVADGQIHAHFPVWPTTFSFL